MFVLMMFSTVSAVEFSINEEYAQGSAILTKISGSFQETLEEENILFYRGHVRVPMNFELNKIADEYHLYVNLADKDPNNYSIILEEIEYLEGANVIEEDIRRNFTITEEIADFSISEGFIITEDDFTITIQNLKENRINLTYEFITIKTDELFSGEIIDLDFSVKDAPLLEIKNIKLSSENTEYEIPVYVLSKPESVKPVMFEFESKDLNVTMDLINQTKRIVFIKNTGEGNIFQIKLSLSEDLERYVQLSREEILNVEPGFSYPIQLTFVSGELPSTENGELTAISSGNREELNITLKFFPGYVESEEERESLIRTCSELGGNSCRGECDGELTEADDGTCCLGQCSSGNKSSSSGKIIGWFLILALIAGGVWLYLKKYRKAEAPKKGVFKFLKK